MDTYTCVTCLDIFERALSSPIGVAYRKVIESTSTSLDDHINLNTVGKKLAKNEYKTPKEFLDDLEKTVNDSVHYFGANSDLSLALYSIKDRIEEKIKPFLPGNTQKWEQMTKDLRDTITPIILNFPNNIDAFREYMKGSTGDDIKTHRINTPIPSQEVPHVDILELKARILKLSSDEDIAGLISIISHYEPEFTQAFSNASGTVVFDLKKCSPNTLKMLQDYVQDKLDFLINPTPITPAQISLPIP